MRQSHLTYLRTLAAGLILGGAQPFQAASNSTDLAQARFLEVEPPLAEFQELVPFCVVAEAGVKSERNGRRIEQLAKTDDEETGTAVLSYLRQHFRQEFKYRLEFWLEDPAEDILSSAVPLDPEEPEPGHSYGLLDQALLYIAAHEYFASEVSATVRVHPGASGLVSDPAGELRLYKLFLEIIFEDGLCEQEHLPTFAGSEFQLRNTTVEKVT
ncbi:MAG: hypothetical protein HS115_11745 [Spirochaetales bacterium]|nr:hypothetical protein [Spirochaetales bacterium]